MAKKSPKSDKTLPVIVSIIIPSHNSARFLSEAIQAVQTQTFKHWELIVADIKSADDTVAIATHFAEKDPRIKIVSTARQHDRAHALIKGIDAAVGQLICFLNPDDLWRRDKLEEQLKFLQKKSCAVSVASYEFAEINGRGNGKKVIVPAALTARQLARSFSKWGITAIFDTRLLGKTTLKNLISARALSPADEKKLANIATQDEVLCYHRPLKQGIITKLKKKLKV